LPVVAACVAHKAGIVARDERESGERASLNLGHTLGHALEADSLERGQDLPHGVAVAIGVAFACHLAHGLSWLDGPTRDRALALGAALGLPLAPSRPLDLDALRRWLSKDKKARRGRPRWVLLRGLGAWGLTEAEDDVVAAALAELGRGRS
jgi:3-dehydroquinate synthase